MGRFLKFKPFCLPTGRLSYWLMLVAWSTFAGSVVAQQFPYMAYVTGEQIYVRSGPGQRYYPTGQIPPGFAIEVYRHDGEGWCAVRPPAGSFSWVSSHQVRSLEAGIVEVVDDHVVARIGSSLSPNRSAVQVLLPKGERMELLPAEENDDPRWIRVAAPAGEFRWVAAGALSRQPPIEAAPLPKAAKSGWARQSEHVSEEVQAEPNAFEHLNATDNNVQAGLQFDTPKKIPVNDSVPMVQSAPNALDVVVGSPAELQLAQFQAQPSSIAPPALLSGSEVVSPTERSSQPRVRFRGLTPPASVTVGTVEELELRLSQTVVQPPKQWELGPLEAAANGLLAGTKSPPTRAQLREVLARIERFKQVQDRYNNPMLPAPVANVADERDPFATTIEADESSAGGLTGLASSVRDRAKKDLVSNSDTASADKPLYDATGLLKPVVSKREQAPQYALVDEQGKVVSFVTPTPDLNLKPYIGRRIGVNGKRGFMPEYRRAHVTAGRVTPLTRR